MATATLVPKIPQCDICWHEEHKVTPAYADASLKRIGGTWAYVCREHFGIYGCSLGTGSGQKLIPAAKGLDDREEK